VDLNVGVAEALGTDYFYIREQLTSAQLVYLARTREFVTAEVQPVINGYWERAEFPWPLIEKLSQTQTGRSSLCVVARVRLGAARNDSQYLAANRGAAGPDEEPVGREGPP